jgi:hypothetical protein
MPPPSDTRKNIDGSGGTARNNFKQALVPCFKEENKPVV